MSSLVAACGAEGQKHHHLCFMVVMSGQAMVTHQFILLGQTMSVDLLL